MNALALHLPERRGVSRWTLAGLIVLAAHAAVVASVAFWYARTPPEPNILPAIAVSLAPIEGSSPEIQNQDIAVGPTMQQAEEAPTAPPKVEEQKVEEQVEPPTPPQEADVTLPKEEPKPIEKPTPAAPPPAPETRAPPKAEHVGRFTEAASNLYMAQILGHLQRFRRYPLAAHNAVGTAMVRFVLNRAGEVIGTEVTKSSGSEVLDREALSILKRASPFPPFPAAKPGAQDYYIAPIKFDRG